MEAGLDIMVDHPDYYIFPHGQPSTWRGRLFNTTYEIMYTLYVYSDVTERFISLGRCVKKSLYYRLRRYLPKCAPDFQANTHFNRYLNL